MDDSSSERTYIEKCDVSFGTQTFRIKRLSDLETRVDKDIYGFFSSRTAEEVYRKVRFNAYETI